MAEKQQDFGRPSWDEGFMYSALTAATRSSCTHIKSGAVIVKDKRVIASGYNGAPPGIKNCLEVGCRKEREHVSWEDKGKSVCRGVHAEINAMSQIARENLIGTTMYTVFFPCSACAKSIVGNGISEVVFLKNYAEPDTLTKELFCEAGVKLRQMNIDVKKQCNRIINVANQKKE